MEVGPTMLGEEIILLLVVVQMEVRFMENILYYQREDPMILDEGRILLTTSVDAYMAELAGHLECLNQKSLL